MSTTKRIIIGIIIIAALAAIILAVDSSRRGGNLYRILRDGSEKFSGECIPVYSGKDLLSKFCRENAARLAKKSFTDRSENKPQEGWLLRDVLLLSVKKGNLAPQTMVRVSSTSRGKVALLAWKDVSDEANLIILAPTKQGTLKLASVMKGLDTRTKWIQDVDKIEIVRP
jgi:hypothetical protein